MKRIFSTILLGVTLFTFGAAITSCTEEIVDINDEVALGRCLTPTELSAKITGEFIEFSWTKSKGATKFVLELFTDEQMTGEPVNTFDIPAEELPYTVDLEADMSYYARVKGVNADGILEDSKWAVFDRALQTYAIKSSLNPQFVSSGLNSITIKWTADSEVDHVRITPALDEEDEYTRFDINATAVEAAQVEVAGLKPSVKYTLALHFKSADRGQVVAWTQPDTQNAVRVATIDEFKAAYANGQSKFVFAYSDTPYEYGEFKVDDFTHDLEIYGEPSEDGEFPTLLMNTKPSATVKKLHFERMHLCGAPGATVDASNYFVNVQNVGQDIESITFLNCKITEFERALYYDNNNGKLGSLVIKECEVNTVKQSFIDSRQKGSSAFGSLLIENSTIQNIGNAFLRFAAGVTPSITLKNNTIYNCGYASGHNLGFISVAEPIETFTMESNLIIGMTDVSGSQKNQLFVTTKAKSMNKNFFYDCYKEFIGDEAAVTYATAGGAVLENDPVVDAVGGLFNVTDASVKAAGAGDPRWLMTYVEVPEDLTQAVTQAVTTWDLADAKVFRGKADKDMVRGNIRFYVQNTPFNLGGGKIEFTGKSTVGEDGLPADAGMGIKVNQSGSLVVSTAASELAGTHAHLTVSLNGKVSASVPVGAEYQKVTFPNITEAATIYLTACDPIAITFLQWTSDVQVLDKVLATPDVKISKTTVNERADDNITLTWDAIDYAGSYNVTVDGNVKNVTETTYTFNTSTFKVEEAGGDFAIKVTAVPAADDYTREESKAAELSFHVNDVPEEPGVKVVRYELAFPSAVNDAGKYVCGTNDGFFVTAPGLAIDASTAAFAEAGATVHDTEFTTRLKGSTSKTFTITVPNDGVLYLAARSSNGTATGRTISLTQNGTVILEPTVCKDADLWATDKTKTYPYVVANVKAGEITVSMAGDGGINLYGIRYDATEGSVAKVEKIWDFSSSAWTTAMSAIEKNKDDSNWNLDVDGLKMVAGGGTIKWNTMTFNGSELYYWQIGGSGSETKRYFEFTTDVAGTVSVYASGTNDTTEPTSRKVVVKAANADAASLAAAYPKTEGPVKLDFNVAPGVVKVYTDASLIIYKIEFHQN